MKSNVGTIDRTIRIIVGLVIISLVFWGPKSPWGYIGIIPLLSGLFGTCPCYSLLGISTCKIKK